MALMEDLYYLTKTDTELEDIAACAEEFGYRHYYVTRAYRDLVIHYSEGLHLDAPAPWAAQVVAGVPSSTFAAPLRYPIGERMSPIGPAPMISTDSCAPVSTSSWRLTQ